MPRFIAAIALSFAFAAPAAAGSGLAFPVYGNWCGPYHGAGPAVDGLDSMCKRHDSCYERKGNQDCGCDLVFLDELRRSPWPSEAYYLQARAIYEAMALVPCVGTPGEQQTKLDWMRNDHAGAVARGREAPDAAFKRLLHLIGTGLTHAYELPR